MHINCRTFKNESCFMLGSISYLGISEQLILKQMFDIGTQSSKLKNSRKFY